MKKKTVLIFGSLVLCMILVAGALAFELNSLNFNMPTFRLPDIYIPIDLFSSETKESRQYYHNVFMSLEGKENVTRTIDHISYSINKKFKYDSIDMDNTKVDRYSMVNEKNLYNAFFYAGVYEETNVKTKLSKHHQIQQSNYQSIKNKLGIHKYMDGKTDTGREFYVIESDKFTPENDFFEFLSTDACIAFVAYCTDQDHIMYFTFTYPTENYKPYFSNGHIDYFYDLIDSIETGSN